MRGAIRLLLLFWALASATALALTLTRIATDPGLAPWREATLAEISATTDRLLAREATPERLASLIAARLAETPRNWMALDALRQLAVDRGLALPAPLTADFDRLRAEDSGLLATTGTCLACAWDAATCSLTQALVCNAPVTISPVGDVLGLARGLKDYALDNPVDGFDLSLSVVGLGATILALPSGGSTEVVKAGAGLLKTAARMGRISPPLRGLFETALRQGIRWDRVLATDWLADPARLVRAEAFAPATRTVQALDEMRGATDLATVLHVLPMVETAGDAAALLRVAKATGKGFLARAEVLGKSRLLRASLRVSRIGAEVLASFLSLGAALASLAGHAISAALQGSARRRLRAKVNRG